MTSGPSVTAFQGQYRSRAMDEKLEDKTSVPSPFPLVIPTLPALVLFSHVPAHAPSWAPLLFLSTKEQPVVTGRNENLKLTTEGWQGSPHHVHPQHPRRTPPRSPSRGILGRQPHPAPLLCCRLAAQRSCTHMCTHFLSLAPARCPPLHPHLFPQHRRGRDPTAARVQTAPPQNATWAPESPSTAAMQHTETGPRDGCPQPAPGHQVTCE